LCHKNAVGTTLESQCHICPSARDFAVIFIFTVTEFMSSFR
jgi:hypothetical protein